ncbi:hypothetical protein V8E54_013202 [Elaphomyces granulatus]
MVQFRDTLEMLRNDDLSLTSWEFLSSRTKINLSPEIASFDQALRLYSTNAKVDLFDHNRLRDSGMPVKEAYSVRLPSVMITGLDEVIENYLMTTIETDPYSSFTRLPTDTTRLATKVSRSTPVCLSREADTQQSM